MLKSIVINGFIYNKEKYVCLTASAGQIRTKKTVFIKESLYKRYEKTLTCGLTLDKINAKGGINVNKYLAYLALCNSATDPFEQFDIDKAIVVEDMETLVKGEVDFIDDKTYQIERKVTDVPICHTDGCGMIRPDISKKNMMVRLPWVKGLLASFPFDKFVRQANRDNPKVNHGIVCDIYGKEWDILRDDIQFIFTKSQFKMWKFYESWDDYKTQYKQHNCKAGKCNEEEDKFRDAKINYQMLQTLSDLSDEELIQICSKTAQKLENISTDFRTMLNVFGATKLNTNKNPFQECLYIYPELLHDAYCRETLRDIRESIRNDACGGRLDIDGKYTFIIPDLYAFCEWLFLKDENPKGLLEDGEVYCSLFPKAEKLDCLRSPHLYMEHAVRKNAIDKRESIKLWFKTPGVYTSCHDLISKILQFDVDGDKSLVCADTTIINAAERNTKNVVPLFYNMAKAGAQIIDGETIYNGLIAAYVGGNIGQVSNNITKIWNAEKPDIEAVKILCMENNFTIDYAKTLYKPTRPSEVDKKIKLHTHNNVPYFFINAKGKLPTQVEAINNSCVNRIRQFIPNKRIRFSPGIGSKLDKKMLMMFPEASYANEEDIIIRFKELTANASSRSSYSGGEQGNIEFIYESIAKEMSLIEPDRHIVTDVLVNELFGKYATKRKRIFWACYGDVVLENLKANIDDDYFLCEDCGKRMRRSSNSHKLCKSCREARHKVLNRERMRKSRNSHRDT